jgi:hypothetical protein
MARMHSMSACAGMPQRRRMSTVCLHGEAASACTHVRSCAYLRPCMRERVRMLAVVCSRCQHAFATMVSTLVASLQESCALPSCCPLPRTDIASARTAQSRILHDELADDALHAQSNLRAGRAQGRGEGGVCEASTYVDDSVQARRQTVGVIPVGSFRQHRSGRRWALCGLLHGHDRSGSWIKTTIPTQFQVGTQ